MLTVEAFIRKSLELQLFFLRIMKEHALFLEVGFMMKDYNQINYADYLRQSFDSLLSEAITLSQGVLSEEVLNSGELFTPFTLDAETSTSNLTGIAIPTNLTVSEQSLVSKGTALQGLEQAVSTLNKTSAEYIKALINFKTTILGDVNSCALATNLYPMMLEHLLMEANEFLSALNMLENREMPVFPEYIKKQEQFWDEIMGEHSKFIRGMLDPSEDELIYTANNFSNEFEELEERLKQAKADAEALKKLTEINTIAVKQLRDFKQNGTDGILNCKVKSIILPLLADHVLREANHYLRLLGEYKKML